MTFLYKWDLSFGAKLAAIAGLTTQHIRSLGSFALAYKGLQLVRLERGYYRLWAIIPGPFVGAPRKLVHSALPLVAGNEQADGGGARFAAHVVRAGRFATIHNPSLLVYSSPASRGKRCGECDIVYTEPQCSVARL